MVNPTDEIRSISLTAPWGTAMQLGYKRIETRSWKTPYRGWIAIHQAAGFPAWAKDFAVQMRESSGLQIPTPANLPRGVILCLARLVAVEPTASLAPRIGALERGLGDYSSGRWGWVCEDFVALARPYAYQGHQGLRAVPTGPRADIQRLVAP